MMVKRHLIGVGGTHSGDLLASNLYSCGVSPKVIQAIMRHSDIGTTLQFYLRTPDDEARQALQKI
jgi:hypothetical protein